MDKRTVLVVAAVTLLTAAGGVAFFLFGGAGGALGGAAGVSGFLGEEAPIHVTGSPSAVLPCDTPGCTEPESSAGDDPTAYAVSGAKKGAPLSPAQIGAVVKSKLPRVQACYEFALKRDPDLAGKVVVSVAVDGEGRARTEVRDDGLAPAAVAGCVASTLARLKYPASGGGEVAAVFPFVFSPSR